MKYIKEYREHKTRTEIVPIRKDKPKRDSEVTDAINQYAPWFDITKVKTLLYRSTRETPGDIKIIHPKESTRTTQFGNLNYYNHIFDSSPYWEGYPKRNSSVIVGTNYYTTKFYGTDTYVVIPFKENTKFAKADSKDLWHAMKHFGKAWSVEGLEPFGGFTGLNNASLRTIMTLMKDIFNLPKNVRSAKHLESLLTFDKARISDFGATKLKEVEAIIEKYGSFMNFLYETTKPIPNNIEIINYNSEYVPDRRGHHSTEGYELWTDEPCLLISHHAYLDYLDSL